MYKSHPITSLLNFILIIIALAMLKNNSILFLIALVLLFLNYKNPNKYYSLFLKATFLFSFLSLLFGTISFLVKVSLLVIYIIEAIRRKPMKEKTEVTIQMLGFAILIGLSIFVTYNDILRIF